MTKPISRITKKPVSRIKSPEEIMRASMIEADLTDSDLRTVLTHMKCLPETIDAFIKEKKEEDLDTPADSYLSNIIRRGVRMLCADVAREEFQNPDKPKAQPADYAKVLTETHDRLKAADMKLDFQ